MKYVLLLLSLALAACGSSADTESLKAADDSGRYSETWSGGPFTASNPLVNYPPVRACPAETSGTPLCHYYRITPKAGVRNVAVAIQPNEGFEADDYDLAVYDEQGELVGASAGGTGFESTLFPTNGSAFYEVRVQPYLVADGSGYSGAATESDTTIDSEIACDATLLAGEDYPDQLGIAGVTDDGREIELSVAVLLDGVEEKLAREVMARAADSYSPLGIQLTVAGVRRAVITTDDSGQIIQEAKDQTSGVPPFGADIAAVFTSRTMQAANATGVGTVLGQADCIGGIRAPYNSYLVATIGPEAPFAAGPFLLDVDKGPETMAHEIGHLMGAHHHYGNCAEGISPEDAERSDISPCDLMFPSVEPLSINFSAFAGAVVRGHAVQYADGNR